MSDQAPRTRPLSRRAAKNYGLDTRRLRRLRLIWGAIVALPLLLLALLALKFVSLPVTQAWHDSAYDEGRYDQAIERLAPIWFANWFEPYLGHLSEGTNHLQAGRYPEAEAELRRSLEAWEAGKDLNQPMHAMCKIRNNLALAIEHQALELSDAQDKADRLYEAEEIIAPCASGGGGGDDGNSEASSNGNEDQETTSGNSDRIEQERREADEEAGNDPNERPDPKDQNQPEEGEPGEGGPMDNGEPKKSDPDGEEPPEEAPSEDPDPEQQRREDELELRNRDANSEDSGSGGESSDTPPTNPW